jgi:sulfide:quinone oxidoreductase
MKKLLILGAGTGGTIMANRLNKVLDSSVWEITIVDEEKIHYYQPGFLFIPFGIYTKKDVIKQKADFIPSGVKLVFSKIDRIEPAENYVLLDNGTTLQYDWLIIATGTRLAPEETPGLKDKLWYKKIFDFYSIEGAVALCESFRNWEGGKLVLAISEMPIKCPVAPLEFVFLADSYFTKKGIRNKVDISFATPLPGAFTKPRTSKLLGELMEEKNINVFPEFYIERIDNDGQKIISYDQKEVPFDILVIVPVNMGSEVIQHSGMGDDLGFIPTDKYTLRSSQYENIFILGDASNIPTSKSGSAVHFASDIIYENFLSAIEGHPLNAKFDGHSNCYIETGFSKGSIIDFNYDTEPLPGTYPVPGIGPFRLLKNTGINHFGKLLFRWIYWHILLKGRHLPVKSQMSMAGKHT